MSTLVCSENNVKGKHVCCTSKGRDWKVKDMHRHLSWLQSWITTNAMGVWVVQQLMWHTSIVIDNFPHWWVPQPLEPGEVLFAQMPVKSCTVEVAIRKWIVGRMEKRNSIHCLYFCKSDAGYTCSDRILWSLICPYLQEQDIPHMGNTLATWKTSTTVSFQIPFSKVCFEHFCHRRCKRFGRPDAF